MPHPSPVPPESGASSGKAEIPAVPPAATELNLSSDRPILHGTRALTPEEQMARFEEDLKEADWGHQPC